MKKFYNPRLKSFSRQLRKKGILSEVLFWLEVKNRKLLGYRFLRQRPIGNYIVDFYCPKLKLAIEIDGSSHDSPIAMERDLRKDRYLESVGIKVIRYRDSDVKNDIGSVIQGLKREIGSPLNPPSTRGE